MTDPPRNHPFLSVPLADDDAQEFCMTATQVHPSDRIETPQLPLAPLGSALTEEEHLKKLEDEDKWKCLKCDPSPLREQRAHYWAITRFHKVLSRVLCF